MAPLDNLRALGFTPDTWPLEGHTQLIVNRLQGVMGKQSTLSKLAEALHQRVEGRITESPDPSAIGQMINFGFNSAELLLVAQIESDLEALDLAAQRVEGSLRIAISRIDETQAHRAVQAADDQTG